MSHKPALLLVVLVALFYFSGCAPGPNTASLADAAEPAGFLLGLWHGLIVIITFIVSLFNDNVGVYEVQNNGTMYNLGYIIGLCITLGGSGKGSNRRSKD